MAVAAWHLRALFLRADLNLSNEPFGLVPNEINRQQAVLQIRRLHLYSVSQEKSLAELPRSNATIEVVAILVVLRLSADDKLLVFEGNVEIFPRETGNGNRDPQRFRAPPVLPARSIIRSNSSNPSSRGFDNMVILVIPFGPFQKATTRIGSPVCRHHRFSRLAGIWV
jgi:hypothetical protein